MRYSVIAIFIVVFEGSRSCKQEGDTCNTWNLGACCKGCECINKKWGRLAKVAKVIANGFCTPKGGSSCTDSKKLTKKTIKAVFNAGRAVGKFVKSKKAGRNDKLALGTGHAAESHKREKKPKHHGEKGQVVEVQHVGDQAEVMTREPPEHILHKPPAHATGAASESSHGRTEHEKGGQDHIETSDPGGESAGAEQHNTGTDHEDSAVEQVAETQPEQGVEEHSAAAPPEPEAAAAPPEPEAAAAPPEPEAAAAPPEQEAAVAPPEPEAAAAPPEPEAAAAPPEPEAAAAPPEPEAAAAPPEPEAAAAPPEPEAAVAPPEPEAAAAPPEPEAAAAPPEPEGAAAPPEPEAAAAPAEPEAAGTAHEPGTHPDPETGEKTADKQHAHEVEGQPAGTHHEDGPVVTHHEGGAVGKPAED